MTSVISFAIFFNKSGSEAEKRDQPPIEKLDYFELVGKLDSREITNIDDIILMYGEPEEIEIVRGDESAKRFFFKFGPKEVLILHVRASSGEITGHQLVMTYN